MRRSNQIGEGFVYACQIMKLMHLMICHNCRSLTAQTSVIDLLIVDGIMEYAIIPSRYGCSWLRISKHRIMYDPTQQMKISFSQDDLDFQCIERERICWFVINRFKDRFVQ